MFKFFKKKNNNNMQEWEYKLLDSVACILPTKYSFLTFQINKEFILDSVPNDFLGNGWKRVVYNHKLYSSLKNIKINYKLVGILVYDLGINNYIEIELDLYEGIIIGYKIEKNSNVFNYEKIDVNNLREVHYANNDRKELINIIGDVNNVVLSQLDIDDTFKIEITEGEFYVIKDYGDGNYLSMNTQGAVFGMIHDPYEVEMLFADKVSFIKAIESGNFDLLGYYDKKNS